MKWIVLVSVLLALLLAGCMTQQPPTCEEVAQQEESPDNLPFETIAQEGSAKSALWPDKDPDLVVLTTPDAIVDIEPYISKEVAVALQDIDFNTSLVVAAFSGQQGHGAWQFCITSVTRQTADINLHTHLIDAVMGPATMTSYYHLIRLSKSDLPSGEVTFNLDLTRHEWTSPPLSHRVLKAFAEETVASVTRSLP